MRQEESKFNTTRDTSSKDILETADEIANMFTSKLNELAPDVPIFTASEDEAVDLEECLVEPVYNNDLVDGVLDFFTFESLKWFDDEDISGNIGYDKIKLDSGQQAVFEHYKRALESLDRMLQGTDNAVPLGDISLPTCQEYLLEAKHLDEVFKLDCGLAASLQNVGLECHSPGVYKRDSGAEMSDLSCGSSPRLRFTDNHNSLLLDRMSVQELHEAFRNMFGHETLVIDKQWLKHHISLGLQNYVELDSGSNLTECGVISNQNDGKSIFSPSVEFFGNAATSTIEGALSNECMSRDSQVKMKKLPDYDSLKTSNSMVSEVELCSLDGGDQARAFATKKRSRRPPRRYIEESLEYESEFYSRKCGLACKRSKNSSLLVGSDKNNRHKEIQAETLLCQDKSSEVGCIQVPFGLPMETNHLEGEKLSPDSEDCKDYILLQSSDKLEIESSAAESQEDIYEDECVSRRNTQKGSKRRKHYTTWTSSEVMKLVEGVSQCGVGRWTEIKKLLFSSCSHRTSVDLKDKWRNLLRASSTQFQIKGELEKDKKQASHQVPESVLQRVRELATIYPYPRQSMST